MSTFITDLGTRCSSKDCQLVEDFLPTLCTYCAHKFCRNHYSPFNHSCSSNHLNNIATNPSTFEEKFNDLLPDPNRKGNEIQVGAERKAERRLAGKELIEKNFGGKKEKEAKLAPVKKLSPILELMKLKQRAKRGDGSKLEVPMLERIYVTVVLVENEEKKDKVELWFKKSISIGKALDLIAIALSVENYNNATTIRSKILSLALPPAEKGGELSKLSNGKLLEECLANGCTLWLARGLE